MPLHPLTPKKKDIIFCLHNMVTKLRKFYKDVILQSAVPIPFQQLALIQCDGCGVRMHVSQW